MAIPLSQVAGFFAVGSVVGGIVAGALLLVGFGACAVRVLRTGVPEPAGGAPGTDATVPIAAAPTATTVRPVTAR